MKSHELAKRLLELPNLEVMQPIPETRNDIQAVEEVRFCEAPIIDGKKVHDDVILTYGKYHLDIRDKYKSSLK